jgi:hypothetical protein
VLTKIEIFLKRLERSLYSFLFKAKVSTQVEEGMKLPSPACGRREYVHAFFELLDLCRYLSLGEAKAQI